jgi:hypothetical protein
MYRKEGKLTEANAYWGTIMKKMLFIGVAIFTVCISSLTFAQAGDKFILLASTIGPVDAESSSSGKQFREGDRHSGAARGCWDRREALKLPNREC